MAFHEEPVVIQRYLEEIGQLVVPVGNDRCRQAQQVGFDFDGTADNVIDCVDQ